MINYIIQVLLFQVLFLAVYDLFLQKETFFKWNRVYLILSSILSFIIPFIKFKSIQQSIPQEYIEQLPTVFLNPQEIIIQSAKNESAINFLVLLFFIGVALFTVLFLVKLYKIIQLILSNTVIKYANYKLVLIEHKQSAFSFFNYIFIKKSFIENKELAIIQHELVHCKQLHTLDLLFFEVLKIVMWFNPLVYVYQNRITVLHEYISDAAVIKQTDKNSYFNKILSEIFEVEHISFINQFFKHSLIKKRIVMITKERSQKVKQLKYLLLLPLILVMLLFSSFKIENQKNSIDFTTKNNENLINTNVNQQSIIELQKPILKSIDTVSDGEDIPFAEIENVPVFVGCEGTQNDLRQCFQESITKHISLNFNSNIANGLGLSEGVKRIFVLFKINKDGNVTDIKAKAAHKDLEEEAVRVVQSLPKMKPGMQNGKPVNVKYALPIAFMVKSKSKNDTKAQQEVKTVSYESDDVPFAIIENVPVFPGCNGTQEELKHCLQQKITEHVSTNFNSNIAKSLGLKPGIQKIYVIFKINKDGNITDINARASHKDIETEAIRVVQSLPKMIPGKNKGKNVGVKYSLPIAFKIDDTNLKSNEKNKKIE